MSVFAKAIKLLYPYVFKILHFRRFRAKYCRFGPSQLFLGKNSYIAEGSIIKIANHGKVIIGNDCYIGEFANIRCDKKIEIRDRVHIGQFVTIVDADYSLGSTLSFKNRNISQVIIGDDTFIGSNSCILRGTNIKPKSAIPALSKITR